MPARTQSNAWGAVGWLPVVWLCLVMALSARGFDQSLVVMQGFDLPDAALYLVYASMIVAVVTILWGLYLLSLAFSRSTRFRRAFILWQLTIMAFLLAKQVYVLVAPNFAFSIEGLAWDGGEIVIGLLLIFLVGRTDKGETLFGSDQRARPSLLVSAIAAVLGVVVGGAVGAGVGLAGGSAISELTDMSCFEGACGYFVVLVGLAAMLVGAIGGGIFAVWRVNRRKPSAAA
ncbi:hypothetical protein [Aminobacter sp. AP02]|uniref:hypothetical protein n=1 Tax=Aminobacter sp. AP02 TaxID=2135737 RepID=UPI000D6D7F4D|nr:hypothetical protein [Aminobacter sp. AP02]PWK70722.1 hypothetical protein C8K44_107202 [Aminobacter sp. AP02]